MKLSYNQRQHSYWLDGKRCKGVTSVAGIPDDTYNLQKWQQRTVALGMALPESGPLRDRAIAHFDDRSELGDIAEDAMRAAKAHEKAARGTAFHRVLERHDLGQSLIDTPENRALRTAYDKALQAAGLVVVEEYVERIVVHEKQLIAGRFDRYFKRKRDGKLVVGDVKTGSIKYPHKMAVQLAMYVNADLLAGPIPGSGGETEVFEKLPENLDRKWGYIIHAPDADHVDIVKIDIAKGWTAFTKAIVPTLAWRKEDDLTKEVGSVEVADLLEAASDERVSWIKGRLQLLTMLDNADAAKRMVALAWPAEVAKPKSGGAWSEQDIDALDAVISHVERECSAGFPVRDPAKREMKSA